jgi:MFS family permease
MMKENRVDAPRVVTSTMASEEASVYAKVTWRIVPLLFLCYIVAYLDRVNVGFAKLQMLSDLHFSETVYGLGAGIFFIGYFLFEVPSNIILHRIGARVWIARVMITWALISAAMMYATTPTLFYVMRFALGLAEAGLFPGVILYLTYWYPAPRRAKMLAYFIAGIPVAGIVGGPLSGWILHAMPGVYGLKGWQWLFLLEALPSLIMGIVVLLYLDNGIKDARWLTETEKAMLAANIAQDDGHAESHRLRDGFTNPRVWLLSAIYFCFIMGLYGVGFYLPTLIKGAGVSNPLTIGILTMLPYAAAVVTMILNSADSDRKRERRWHLAIPGLIGALAWIVSAQFGHNTVVAMLGLTVATMAVCSTQQLFWALPTAIFTGAAAASGIAVINSVGNLAGFLSPYLIGWIIDRTHSTNLGVYTLAFSIALGGLLALTSPKRLVNR